MIGQSGHSLQRLRRAHRPTAGGVGRVTDAGSQPRGGGCAVQPSRPGVVKPFLSVRLALGFDAAKSDRNQRERGLPFERVAEFDFSMARIWLDTRRVYSKPRYLAMGYLGCRLHVICFVLGEHGLRVISLRKANQREGDRNGFPLTRDR